MAAAGYQAEQNLEKAIHDFDGKFICVIEGALPGTGRKILTLGPKGKTSIEVAKEVTAKAAATICIGSCSCFGNIQAAKPNPTDCRGHQQGSRNQDRQYRRLPPQCPPISWAPSCII